MHAYVTSVTGIILSASLLFSSQKKNGIQSYFISTELLGRPTDSSVTVNALADTALQVFFEYGTDPSAYTDRTDTSLFPGNTPIETVLNYLQPDTRYYYRMRYCTPGDSSFSSGEEHRFHTCRRRGSTFVFTITADSHLRWCLDGSPSGLDTTLYKRTLQNIAQDSPDFHLDMGDAFAGLLAINYDYAIQYHLEQRAFLDRLCHSVPLFLVPGNHEHEVGWALDGTADNRAVWATTARKRYFCNPSPDRFYTGDTTVHQYVGLRENYYAWEWGDALFVVLDPFWYTTTCPHSDLGSPPGGGSGDGWDWTLGYTQYAWLKQTLEQSSAPFKFIFSHHMTAGSGIEVYRLYARGGIEGAHLWEWGGYNEDDTWGFDTRRPGWEMPIHHLMARNRVTVFFHGHDHVFAKQELDGIVYQEVPSPDDYTYGYGHKDNAGYTTGTILTNSGHLRVTVTPDSVLVEYVRAYRPQDEDSSHVNGRVACSYTIMPDSNSIFADDNHQHQKKNGIIIKTFPNPCSFTATIEFHIRSRSMVSIVLYDTRGRIIRKLFNRVADRGRHTVFWDGISNSNVPVGSGTYFCEVRAGDCCVRGKIIYLEK